MTRLLALLALALVAWAVLRREGYELHRDCLPHEHAERNLGYWARDMQRWGREQAASLAVLRREPHAEADLWRDEPGGGW